MISLCTAYGEQPYIRIAQCQDLTERCVIPIKGTQDLELDCAVIGVKPPVTLVWTREGLENRTFGSTVLGNQTDGTWNVAVNLRIPNGNNGDVNNTVNFTCTATGAAVNGTVEETVYTYVSADSNGNDQIGQCHKKY